MGKNSELLRHRKPAGNGELTISRVDKAASSCRKLELVQQALAQHSDYTQETALALTSEEKDLYIEKLKQTVAKLVAENSRLSRHVVTLRAIACYYNKRNKEAKQSLIEGGQLRVVGHQ
jgi:hypothetical protein